MSCCEETSVKDQLVIGEHIDCGFSGIGTRYQLAEYERTDGICGIWIGRAWNIVHYHIGKEFIKRFNVCLTCSSMLTDEIDLGYGIVLY